MTFESTTKINKRGLYIIANPWNKTITEYGIAFMSGEPDTTSGFIFYPININNTTKLITMVILHFLKKIV